MHKDEILVGLVSAVFTGLTKNGDPFFRLRFKDQQIYFFHKLDIQNPIKVGDYVQFVFTPAKQFSTGVNLKVLGNFKFKDPTNGMIERLIFDFSILHQLPKYIEKGFKWVFETQDRGLRSSLKTRDNPYIIQELFFDDVWEFEVEIEEERENKPEIKEDWLNSKEDIENTPISIGGQSFGWKWGCTILNIAGKFVDATEIFNEILNAKYCELLSLKKAEY